MAAAPHRARKRFGQNFLIDAQVIARIVAAIGPRADDNLVEIGPGEGALTGPLLARAPGLHALELDRDLVARLRCQFAACSGFEVVQSDALTADFDNVGDCTRSLRVVGNLPYNISTPLLFHLFSFGARIADMHFMLQKEVVERMAASPGGKNYGRLSVMTQYHCQVTPLFDVPADAFRPIPKVTSTLVRLTPHPRGQQMLPRDAAFFGQLVNACFQQRRKTLRNCLGRLAQAPRLAELGMDLGARPETLTVADFVAIANHLSPSP